MCLKSSTSFSVRFSCPGSLSSSSRQLSPHSWLSVMQTDTKTVKTAREWVRAQNWRYKANTLIKETADSHLFVLFILHWFNWAQCDKFYNYSVYKCQITVKTIIMLQRFVFQKNADHLNFLFNRRTLSTKILQGSRLIMAGSHILRLQYVLYEVQKRHRQHMCFHICTRLQGATDPELFTTNTKCIYYFLFKIHKFFFQHRDYLCTQ